MKTFLTITTAVFIALGILYAHTLLLPYIDSVAKVLAGLIGG